MSDQYNFLDLHRTTENSHIASIGRSSSSYARAERIRQSGLFSSFCLSMMTDNRGTVTSSSSPSARRIKQQIDK
ncbi:MAG: hypothetical protein M3270_09970 [Thermoproteota archaeon]|nr:hypothetical protein [Thermoproteota archaeon]